MAPAVHAARALALLALLGAAAAQQSTCVPGTFWDGACSSCPAGTWSGAAASSCTSCAPGQYSATVAANSSATCINCPIGTASNVGGAPSLASCVLCSAGHWAAAGSTTCSSCFLGTYSTATGLGAASSCTPCPSGTYGPTAAAAALSACLNCPAGTSSSATSAVSSATCVACVAGTFAAAGATTCSPCTAGSYCLAGATAPTPCPASTYSAATSATSNATCTNCAAGTYSSATGLTSQLSCLSCSAGTYTAGSAPYALCSGATCVAGTACTYCAVGTYSTTFPGTSSAVCVPCTAGLYSGTQGASLASACIACGQGTWSAAGASSCTSCPPGTYSTLTSQTSQATCLPCGAGTYSTSTGAVSAAACLQCPAGTYATTTANTLISQCLSCPGATYSTTLGATSTSTCLACPGGSWSATVASGGNGPFACTNCTAGTYSLTSGTSLATCTACSAGTFSSVAGASTAGACVTCPAGSWSLASASSCTKCVAGTYATGTGGNWAGVCIGCPVGTYSAIVGQTTATCTNCLAGTFNPVNGSATSGACVSCPAGTYSAAGAASCTNCPAGSSTSGAAGSTSVAACIACPVGTYASAAIGAASCTLCGTGTYSTLTSQISSATCTLCPAGTANSNSGSGLLSACNQCVAGYWAGAGASTCSPCAAGSYSTSLGLTSQSLCTPCPAGFAQSANAQASNTCSQCSYGTYALAGSATCTPCGAGSYNAVTLGGTSAAAACMLCAAGTYSFTVGATSINVCSLCPAGTSGPAGAGSVDACTLCPAGTYAPLLGSTSCMPCGAGIFCPAGSVSNVTPCPAGFYCPATGAPVPCPSGTFGASTGAWLPTACTNCFAGSYGNATAAVSNSTCTLCPGGSFSATPGIAMASQCTSCASNYYCPSGSTTSGTTPCPAGYFCAAGNTQSCPSGTYNSATGATTAASCLNCGTGAYCPSGSTSSAATCLAGWACPGSGAPSLPCAPGYFQPATGQTACLLCLAGSLTSVYGATSCTSCPLGTYSEIAGSNAACTACPAGTFSNFVGAGGATSRAYCQPCPAGYASQPGSSSCQPTIWTPVKPPFPLTGRSFGAVTTNSTALVFMGGRLCVTAACDTSSQSDLSLGFDVRSGALIETHTASAAAQLAVSPTALPLLSQQQAATLLASSTNTSFDRAAQALGPDGSTLYLFGGMSSGNTPTFSVGSETALLWVLNPSSGAPSAALVPINMACVLGVTCPSARKSAGLAYQIKCPGMAGDCLVLVGGDASLVAVADSTWVFDLSAGKWLPPSTATVNAPSPRTGLALVPSPNSSMVYAFGGATAGGVVNDIFVLSPSNFFDSKPFEMTNVALGKWTSQSSIDPSWGQGSASGQPGPPGGQAVVDGNIGTNLGYCLNTYDNDAFTPPGYAAYGGQGTTAPFWVVDLGAANTQVDFIYLYMRSDCCQNRNSGFQIWWSNTNASSTTMSPTPPALSFTFPSSAQQLATPFADLSLGGPQIIPTPGLKTRYLWYVLPSTNRYLTLCEFQAWRKNTWVWRQLSGTYNAALYGAATESSTLSGYGDGLALRAVDGLVTNRLDNAQPYTIAHTTSNDVPGPWWQVDLGQVVQVQYINVFGRNDCCQGRNQNMKWAIGNSKDQTYDQLCPNTPASITPPCMDLPVASCKTTPNCYYQGQTSSALSTPYSFQGQVNSPVPATSGVVELVGNPLTACYVTFPCQLTGRYLTVYKNTQPQYDDTNIIMLGEVQAIANRLLNMPTPRAYMAVTVYSGCLVFFGGADGAGFRYNDLQMFDMLHNMWLAPFTPLGTTPTARASAAFFLLPNGTANAPSNSFALTGGYSNTGQLNDFQLLSFPQCPPYSQLGVQSNNCVHGGTVCYPACLPFATPANGANPVVCGLSGTWTGILPPCTVQVPLAPQSVTATANAAGIATVNWVAPNAGYFNNPPQITQYKVQVVPSDTTESYVLGTWPAFVPSTARPTISSAAFPYGAVAPFTVSCPGSSPCVRPGSLPAGGNWYSLLPKDNAFIGNVWGTNIQPPAPWCAPWPDCTFVTTTSTYDFWNGFLRLDSDANRNNWGDQNDNMVLYRDFPPGLNPQGTWAMETFVSLDTVNILSQGNQMAGLGIVDMSEYGGLGAVEMYTGIRNDGSPYSIGFESSINVLNNWYGTGNAANNNNGPFAAYLRIERDATVAGGVWRAYYKYNSADDWLPQPIQPVDAQLRQGGIGSAATYSNSPPILANGLPGTQADVRPALLSRNWNCCNRAVSLFSYFRIGPLTCSDTGTTRFVSGALSSAQIYGLTQGSSYSFLVQAQSPAGWGALSAVTAAVPIPTGFSTAITLERLVSQNQPCTMVPQSDGFNCGWGNNGILNDFAQADNWWNEAYDGTSGGGNPWNWNMGAAYQIDLGTSHIIDSITVVDRQDCCQPRLDNFQVFVGDDANFNLWNWVGDNTCNRNNGPNPPPLKLSTIGCQGLSTSSCNFAPYSGFQSGWTPAQVLGPTCNNVPGVSGCTSPPSAIYQEFQNFASTGGAAGLGPIPVQNPQPGVMAPVPQLVSQGQPSLLSTTYGSNTANWCNDGNLGSGGNNFCNSGCGSADPNGAWFQIDLGSALSVAYINIYDRQDSPGLASRSDGAMIYVGNSPATTQGANGPNTGPPAGAVASYTGSGGVMTACPGGPFNGFEFITLAMAQAQMTMSAPGNVQANALQITCVLTGRYVIFWVPPTGPNCLNLYEMQVYASPPVAYWANFACNAPTIAPWCNAAEGWCHDNNQAFTGVADAQDTNPYTPQSGRYVTFAIPPAGAWPADGYLNIAELQVMSSTLLVSQGQPCFMSSQVGAQVCGLAFDGNIYGGTHGTYTNNFAMTNNDGEPGPWITVDLGFSTSVNSIKVVGRQDQWSATRRLDGFSVYVGDSPLWSQNAQCNPAHVPFSLLGLNYNAGLFPCALSGRYVTIHIPAGVWTSPDWFQDPIFGNNWYDGNDGYLNLNEMQVFANNACPANVAVGATQQPGTTCTAAGWGATCTYQCNPGWVAVSGSATSRCNGQVWSAPPLVCQPPCADLVAPQYAVTCSQTLYFDDFNVDGSLAALISLNPYLQKVGYPSTNPPQLSKWFQQDGMLQASSSLACSQDLHLAIASDKIFNYESQFTVSAQVNTASRAGLVWRAQDQYDLMRFWFDVNLGLAVVERVVAGVPKQLISLNSGSLFTANLWHTVSVTVSGPNINVTFDGSLLMYTADRTFLVGYAGLYAQSSAFFDNLGVAIQCGGTCSGMTNTDICTFGCQNGLIAVGPVSRSCTGTTSTAATAYSPDPIAYPMYCTLPAPTFLPSTLYILENSPINSPVGDPLVAYATDPNYQVQFQISAVYAMSADLVPYNSSIIVNQGLFWVDVCSGQVKLRTGGQDVMNYEGINNYMLTVRAFVSGFPGAETDLNITVIVLNQDEPPFLLSTAAPIYIPENTAMFFNGSQQLFSNNLGAFVGQPLWWDPENTTLVAFSLTVDGGGGRFVVNATTGAVTLSGAVGANATASASNVAPFLDFESLYNAFSLSITVTQKNDSTKLSTGTFRIALTDVNDPPLLTRGQVLALSEFAQPAVMAGTVQSYDEDANPLFNNGVTIYSLVSAAAYANVCNATNLPTVSGLSSGAPLFAIANTTGVVSLLNLPTVAWNTLPPYISDGALVRAIVNLCVMTTDVFGGTDVQRVDVTITTTAVPTYPYVQNITGLSAPVSTAGGQVITFNGGNFMPTGTAKPARASYSNGVQTFNVTCTLLSNSVMTCPTAAGSGTGYLWSITVDIYQVVFYTPPTMSYLAPLVSAVAGYSSLPTSGGTTLVFTGTNFGPGSGGAKAGYPSVTYGNYQEFVCAYLPSNSTNSQTSISCTTTSGVGIGLPWTLTVAGQVATMTGTVPTISYALPSITNVVAVLPATTSALPTTAMTSPTVSTFVTITGANFGPINIMNSFGNITVASGATYGYGIVAQFGGLSGTMLTFASCNTTIAHTTLSCMLVPGVGINHRVVVAVGGATQVSAPWPASAAPANATACVSPNLCYAAPSVTSMSGATLNAATSGGQLITLIGSGFGPATFPIQSINSVTYGHALPIAGISYVGHYVLMPPPTGTAAPCNVLSDTTISCTTAPGVGTGLTWAVTIGNQVASMSGALLTGYASPQVFTFSGPGASAALTASPQLVTIQGLNFGPIDAYYPGIISATYGVGLADGGPSFPIKSVMYTATGCVVTVPHVTMQCSTVPGAGESLAWSVVVDSQLSSTPTTNYAAPVITSINNQTGAPVTAANVNGGDVILLNGLNFGPVLYNATHSLVQLVTYGLVGSEFTVPATNWSILSQTQIKVTLQPGVGMGLHFIVTVADQASAPSLGTFSYAVPAIVAVIPGSAPTYSNPLAATVITIKTLNMPLLDSSSRYVLYLGQGQYQQSRTVSFPVVRFPLTTGLGVLPPSITPNPDGTINATFSLPTDGAGVLLSVSISIFQGSIFQGSSSAAIATTAVALPQTFSYQNPTIAPVIGVIVSRALFLPAPSGTPTADYLPCPFVAASNFNCSDSTLVQLTISGTNFGANNAGPSALWSAFGGVESFNDGVTRQLQLLVAGSVVATTSPGLPYDTSNPSMLWLYSWSHTQIIAFTHLTAATVAVTLTTTSTYLQPSAATVSSATQQGASFSFNNLSPSISALTGLLNDVPTQGGSTVITATVVDLKNAVEIGVFIGGDMSTGVEATLLCAGVPCSDNRTSILAGVAANGGTVTLRFYAPASQGASQSIVVVAGFGSSSPLLYLSSTSTNVINYATPIINTASVMTSGGWPTSSSNPVSVNTDGSDIVRIIGTNFGTSPVLTVGDGFVLAFSSGLLTRCDPPNATHTCLQFSPPPGEGNGKFFVNNGTLLYPSGYSITVSTPRPYAGFPAPLSQTSLPQNFAYNAPSVTSIGPSSPSSFPTSGGTTITLSGSNFGTSSPTLAGWNNLYNRPTPLATDPLGQSLTIGPQALICTNFTRFSHTSASCTLPVGAGVALSVVMTVAGLSSPSASVGRLTYSAPVIARAYVIPGSTVLAQPMTGVFVALSTANNSAANGSVTSVMVPVNSSLAVNGLIAVPVPPGSSSTVLRAATIGGDYIVLEGINFGAGGDAMQCAFMSWLYRVPNSTQVCNGQEDFLGEGEVPQAPANASFWTHTQVIFRTNAGLGAKEVELSINGNVLSSGGVRPLFTYNDPVVTNMTPAIGNTRGGDLITLVGANFGPPILDTTTPANQIVQAPSNGQLLFTTPLPLSIAPMMSTAFLVVVVGTSCVTEAFDSSGSPIKNLTVGPTGTNPLKQLNGESATPPLPGCAQGFAVQGDGVITFALPPGIGVHKNVTVVVIEAHLPIQQSAPQYFSYLPPTITSFSPEMLQLTPTPGKDESVSIYGNNFGDEALKGEDQQNWNGDELPTQGWIGGIMCDSMQRLDNASIPVLTCTFPPQNLPCGYTNATVKVVGQRGTSAAQPSSVQLGGGNVLPFIPLLLTCGPGFFGHVGETCLPCPAQYPATPQLTGAFCPGYSINLASSPYNPADPAAFTYPMPLQGWYNLNSSDSNTAQWSSNPCNGFDSGVLTVTNTTTCESQIEACPAGWQTGTRNVCIVPCDPASSCLADNHCAYGYASKSPLWKCSYCDHGFYQSAGSCIKCPDSPWALIIGFILIVILAGVIGYFLSQKGVNIAVVGIGLDFFQVLAIFANAGVKWPAIVLQLFQVLSAFNLNIEIVAPECVVPDISYKQKFWFIMILPLCVGSVLGVTFVCVLAWKALVMGAAKREWFTHMPALVSSTLALVYVLYLYLTRTIFDVFNCTPTNPSDGYLHMSVANGERCGVVGGTQLTLLPYAVAGLIVYSFGYPAFVGQVVWRNRERAMLDQLLKAKGTGDDQLTNPVAYDLRMTFSRTYFQFKPDFIMWILVILLRKFFIGITGVVFAKNSSFQMAACLMIMFLAYSAQMIFRPYMSPGEYEGVLKSHAESSFSNAAHARIRAQIANIATRGRRATRKNLLNFEGKVDRSAVLGVLTSWLFNYNTVEQVMLFAAVVVCLMGIMYQANEQLAYGGAHDGITAVVMIDIIVAILYYFTVLFTEIAVLYNESSRQKMLDKQMRKSGGKGGKGGKEGGSKRKLAVSDAALGGRLVGEDGEVNTGRIDAQMNPLFLNASGGAAAGASNSGIGLEAIAAQRSPPPPELWALIQQSYVEQAAAVASLTEQLTEAKRRVEMGASGREAEAAEDTPQQRRSVKKKDFAPVSANSPEGARNPLVRGKSANIGLKGLRGNL